MRGIFRKKERMIEMLKFSCEKALLQLAVNTASRTVATKSSIPALEGLQIGRASCRERV